MVRGPGPARDPRKTEPHETHSPPDSQIPIGPHGDRSDRYPVRMEEMRQSVNPIVQCLNAPPNGEIKTDDRKIVPPSREEMKQFTESPIHHSKPYSEGTSIPTGETHTAAEAPKGEFGVHSVPNGTNKPHRCKTKAPGSAHLQGPNMMPKGHMIADVVTIIGTQDIVSGEVDRQD